MPGAASFKRVLDGAPFTDARARRASDGGLGRIALGSCFSAAPVSKDERGAPDPRRTWGGGARRTEAGSRVWALGAPHTHQNQRSK